MSEKKTPIKPGVFLYTLIMNMTKEEQLETGVRLAEVRIWNWIFNFGIPETKMRVKSALEQLKPGMAPCLDGMIKEFSEFLERHR